MARQVMIVGVFQPFLPLSGELTVQYSLLLDGSRVVNPASLRADALTKLHKGHLGITECKQSGWWPGPSKELAQMIDNYDTCSHERTNLRETSRPSEFPSRQWSTVKAEVFQTTKQTLLGPCGLFFQILWSGQTNIHNIRGSDGRFASHGIPELVRLDNRPQFESEPFRKFAQDWSFGHDTSISLRATGRLSGQSMVSSRNLATLTLMAGLAAPLANGYSPTEFLMGRKIRTPVPKLKLKNEKTKIQTKTET